MIMIIAVELCHRLLQVELSHRLPQDHGIACCAERAATQVPRNHGTARSARLRSAQFRGIRVPSSLPARRSESNIIAVERSRYAFGNGLANGRPTYSNGRMSSSSSYLRATIGEISIARQNIRFNPSHSSATTTSVTLAMRPSCRATPVLLLRRQLVRFADEATLLLRRQLVRFADEATLLLPVTIYLLIVD